MFKLTKKSNEIEIIEKYRVYRSLLTRLKIKAKNSYYAELAISYGNDKSKIWRLINEITKRKKSNNHSIKSIVDKKGHKLCDPKLIANSLNEHFSTIGKDMASKFINDANPKDPLDYITTDVKNKLCLSPTTCSEISKLILKLDVKKSCGYDSISNKILKATCNVIVPYITKLFNSCIQEGVFPNCFKTAQVIPLFKGGTKEHRTCYRPISLLPALGNYWKR